MARHEAGHRRRAGGTIMIKYSRTLLAATVLAQSVAAALAAAPGAEGDIKAARTFQSALKAGDRNAAARMVVYPVVLDFPLPPIKSAGELVARWDEFFDSSSTAALLRDKPEQVGWQGVTLANGKVWFNNGKLGTLNLKTDLYRKKLEAAKKVESSMLYPSARGYDSVPVNCATKAKHIRIQNHDDGYRYFVWPKNGSLSQKPELELKGTMEYQGAGGGEAYIFNNGAFRYVFETNRMCEQTGCPDLLTVSRGKREISSQACR
jgi:hypothetical protein